MMIEVPTLLCTHIYSELSLLNPAIVEYQSYLVDTVAYMWTNEHVEEVLQLTLEKASPVIDQCYKWVFNSLERYPFKIFL